MVFGVTWRYFDVLYRNFVANAVRNLYLLKIPRSFSRLQIFESQVSATGVIVDPSSFGHDWHGEVGLE
jgi:hypothetical protein